jgi:hypothetical protein
VFASKEHSVNGCSAEHIDVVDNLQRAIHIASPIVKHISGFPSGVHADSDIYVRPLVLLAKRGRTSESYPY